MTPLGIDRFKGFTVEHGDYVGTSYDRSDRWYIVAPTGIPVVQFLTRQDARDALEQMRLHQARNEDKD